MKSMLTVIFLCFIGLSSAAVWTVNNLPDTDPDFTTLAAAYSAAAGGDTLYIEGSTASYGSLTLSKPLTLIGTGYFLTQNPHTQATGYGAMLGNITFAAGSSGSLLTGCQTGNLAINIGNIIIKGNYLYDLSNTVGIIINTGVTGVAIIQNYLQKGNQQPVVKAVGTVSSLYVANNIIINTYAAGNDLISIPTTSAATIEQNVLYDPIGSMLINNTLFQNNILRAGGFQNGSGNTVMNNIGNSTQFGTANGNQSNVNMATVFTLTGSSDGLYTLLPASPAIGAGVNGYDCGIFGGPAPYVLSGMPEGIPSIYEFSSPGSGFIIPATIKAQAH